MADDLEWLKDWPSHGLTLGEARERIAPDECRIWREQTLAARRMGPGPNWITDRVSSQEARWDRERRDQAWRRVDELERRAIERLLAAVREGKLFAYGRKGGLDSEPQLIAADIWPAFDVLRFDISAAESRAGKVVFLAIRIYAHPALAPQLSPVSGMVQSSRTGQGKAKKTRRPTKEALLVQEFLLEIGASDPDLRSPSALAARFLDRHPAFRKQTDAQHTALRARLRRAVQDMYPADRNIGDM